MFQTSLQVELMRDRDPYWRLTAPLYFRSEKKGLIIVPEKFCTNFASVPRLPVIYAVFGNTAHRPATLHDYLYCYDSDPVMSFGDANDMFFEAMEAVDLNDAISNLMWWAVSEFGIFFYHKHSINSNYEQRSKENEKIWNTHCGTRFDAHMARLQRDIG